MEERERYLRAELKIAKHLLRRTLPLLSKAISDGCYKDCVLPNNAKRLTGQIIKYLENLDGAKKAIQFVIDNPRCYD